MISLGIESTAHTIGVGICESNGETGKRHGASSDLSPPSGIKVLANAKRLYRPPPGIGIIPRVAADHHSEHFGAVLQEALSSAGVSIADVDLYSFSRGPGIGQCLRVSCAGAKFLASRHGKPLLGINHCHAHLEISRGMLGMADPLYVYVSGANTQLITENFKQAQA